MPKPSTSKPLTTRHALIALLALMTAIAAGLLIYGMAHSLSPAILGGAAAFAGSWRFYDAVIN